jgi:adenylate kinase family enzyme
MNEAILLMGPTGSGKTPLGEYLEQHGLFGRRCAHFDFGARLRRADATNGIDAGLTDAELAVVRSVVGSGALLENENFPIAAKILAAFAAAHGLTERDWLVLNGLPRHLGQTRDLGRIVTVRGVIRLDCAPDTVLDRIRLNSGGDRADRTDDSIQDIRARIRTFAQRTAPMLDHYRSKGVWIHTARVDVTTQPPDIVSPLLKRTDLWPSESTEK